MSLSAVTGKTDLMDIPHAGWLGGGIYSGKPLSCKAALAVLEILFEDGLLKTAQELGETLLEKA